jgi:hypothetical protein
VALPGQIAAALSARADRTARASAPRLRRLQRRATRSIEIAPRAVLVVIAFLVFLTSAPLRFERVAAGVIPEAVAADPTTEWREDLRLARTPAPEVAAEMPVKLPRTADRSAPRAACDGVPIEPADLRDPAVGTEIARVLLRDLGAPRTPAMLGAVRAWMRAEGWDQGWLYNGNPIGMVVRGPMVCGAWNSVGVAVLPNPAEGMRLAAIRLQRPDYRMFGYHRIVAAARAGDPVAFLREIAASDWSGASHYGCRDGGGTNRLEELWALTDPAHATALPCR